GWPSYAAWGASGEVSVAHNGVEGLEFSWRATKGTGDWTQQNFLGPTGIENDITWPRMITSGDNHETVHLFVNSYVEYEGQPRALLYSRTNDGGATFDPEHIILNGIGEVYYTEINADDYILAAKGNTVVLLVASPWQDLFFMKSEDNGDSWEKTIIWEHPYPFWDWDVTIADTFFCCDGSANVALDNEGKVHVVFGINRVEHPEVGDEFYLYPFVDGIGYWNEDMERFSNDLNALAPPQNGYANSEMIEDYNYIGWMQDVNGDGEVHLNGWPNTTVDNIYHYQQFGPSNMPAILVDDEGYLHVLFVSTTETYEIGLVNYKHLWYRTTHPIWMGAEDDWGEFIHLTGDIAHIFDESYYPVIGGFNSTTSNLYYIFNTDITPGLAWSDDHAWQTNNIIYGDYPLPVGIDEVRKEESLPVNIFPNPVINVANFDITLENASAVMIQLTDLTGQKVKEVNYGTMASGNTKVSVDVANLPAGVYFYQVFAGNSTASGKIIIR
ncbi:MAG: T9SS type A sorting domain-containing protein, partial [Bacteroidota bacterium]|nr:T9SS type A sorting domain-containing protein [Bacteroidota bacterium]